MYSKVSNIKRGTAAGVVFVAASITLAGCTAESGADEPTSDDPVSITVIKGPFGFEPVTYAVESGLFEEHGLDVTLEDGTTGDATVSQLLSGEAEFGFSNGPATVNAVSQGMSVQVVSGNVNSTPEEDGGVVVPEDSEVVSMADLTGDTVGINGLRNTTELSISTGVDADGGNADDVEYVEIPVPSMLDTLSGGSVGAVYAIPPFKDVSEGSGFREIPNPAEEAGGALDQIPLNLWVASTDFVESNPDVVEAFSSAMAEATEHLNENTDEVRRLNAEWTEMSDEAIEELVIVPFTTQIDTEAFDSMMDHMVHYEFIDSAPQLDEILWPGISTL